MSEIVSIILLVYATLFPIVDPIGNAPIYVGMTQSLADRQRARLARDVAVSSFFLLLGSVFVGSYVLEFFGISMPVVRIAGGLVVAALGWRLLNAEPQPDRMEAAEAGAGGKSIDAFYPLTMPLTVGPGSISVAITLGSQRPADISLAHLAVMGGSAIVGLVAIALTVYLVYRFAHSTIRRLGRSGMAVIVRLSAFLMLCIGIQILWGGWTSLHG